MKLWHLILLVSLGVLLICSNIQAQQRSRYMDMGDKYLKQADKDKLMFTEFAQVEATQAIACYIAAGVEK